jgi:Glycosyl hydrolase family 26
MTAFVRRWTFPAALLVLVVLVALVLGPVQAQQANPLIATGTATVTTDAGGYATIPHSLGVVPSYVGVSIKSPVLAPVPVGWQADTYTATSFRVRFWQQTISGSQLQVYASKTVTVTWLVEAAGTPPTTTTTTTTTTLPPTTTTTLPTTTTAPPPAPGPWRSGVHTGSYPADYTPWSTWLGRQPDGNLQYSNRSSWAGLENPWFLGYTWPGELISAQPFWPDGSGSTLAACAGGTYDTHWQAYGTNLVNTGHGSVLTELAWEFNLYPDWVADPAGYAACFRRIVGQVHVTAPNARFAWTMNAGSADPTPMYPGDTYVDVVGVDQYDMWPASTSEATWTTRINQTAALQWAADFAVAHNKQLVVPEWGLAWTDLGGGNWSTDANHGGDNPFYINHMIDWFHDHASLLYLEMYFNATGGTRSYIYPNTVNPNSAAAYKAKINQLLPA